MLDWIDDHIWIVPLAFILVVAGVIGCTVLFDSNPHVDENPVRIVVIDKDHHSAYTQMALCGKVFVPIYHPERWSMARRCFYDDGAHWDYEVSLTEATWSTYGLGDSIGRVPDDGS